MSKNIMHRLRLSILAIMVLAVLTFRTHAATPTWHKKWNNQLFLEAAQQHKFVLLDLNAAWCHWCHVMEETTYRDPRVTKLLSRHYVIVSVDADSDPDLSSRYGNWGWPATIVLAADGSEIVKRRGYIPPDQFVSLLQAIIDDPSPGPSVEVQAAVVASRGAKLADTERHALNVAFDSLYDEKNGGWGEIHKFVDAPSVELSFLLADGGDVAAAGRARKTLDANLKLIDPVWGGVYQYSDAVDWRSPHFEKLMSFQADDLRLYSEAYARWGDPQYLHAAQSLYGYLTTFLSAADGGFYVSQDSDVSPKVSGHDFYAHDDAGRRALGAPRVDAHEYARETGWAIRALCKYYDVTGDQQAITRATQAARWAVAYRLRQDGGFGHAPSDRDGPFLDDSLAMAQAFLALYQSTAQRSWLTRATATLDFVDRTLRDPKGGYVAAVHTSGPGVFAHAVRTPEQNSAMAATANLGYVFTGGAQYKAMASHAMRYLAAYSITESQQFHPDVLVADREISSSPIHITIVGAKNDSSAQALHAAALRYPSNYLQVEWWDRLEGALPNQQVRYPQLQRPAAFACTASACSMPIFEPSEIDAAVHRTLNN